MAQLSSLFRLITVSFAAAGWLPGLATAQEFDSTVLATEVSIQPDIPYLTSDGYDSRLDVYRPARGSGLDTGLPRPVVLIFHGGGWIGGRKEAMAFRAAPYLEMGFSVVNAEYRLADVALAPAAVEDARCALRWVYQNADRYGFDTGRIVLTGHSAGGHLALIAGMLTVEDGLDYRCAESGGPGLATSLPDIAVAGVINWYGISDVNDLIEGENSRYYAVRWLGSQPNREAIAAQVSPLNHVEDGTPPILTIHGTADAIVPYAHAERLHAALDAQGTPNRLHTIDLGGHGRFTRAEYQAAQSAINDFLRELDLIE